MLKNAYSFSPIEYILKGQFKQSTAKTISAQNAKTLLFSHVHVFAKPKVRLTLLPLEHYCFLHAVFREKVENHLWQQPLAIYVKYH